MQRATRTARATETSAVLSQARSTAVTGRARKSRSGKDREDASSASRVFDAFPPELLQHICNVAAGDDPASPRARATLASLRLACRSLCRAASRVAHRHVVVTRADHARHLLDAIFQDTKKARHSIVVDTDATVPRAKSSFYAPDICALTIRETRPASECGFTGVLTQLPAALRRLPNLDTLLWMMPERPSMDILRAIGKHPKLVKFELIDTQPGPPAPLGHFDERVRDKFFPRIGLVDGLTTLVLRLQVTKLVQFGHELHWRTFCTALHDLQTLETLVIEQVGTYPVTLGALVEGANWPDLRRLALRNVWMENTDDTRLCDFIARHPNIEMLDLSHWFGPSSENGEFTAAVAQLSIALDVLNSQKTHALPNLRHFSMDAPNHRAELMQAAIFKGKAMRPLRHLGVVDNALLSKVSDARYKPTAETAHTVDIADGVVSISLALYEPLFVGLGDLIANAFPNMTSLHLMILRGPRGLDDWPNLLGFLTRLSSCFPTLNSLVLQATDHTTLWSDYGTGPVGRISEIARTVPSLRRLCFGGLIGGPTLVAGRTFEGYMRGTVFEAKWTGLRRQENEDGSDIIMPVDLEVDRWLNCQNVNIWPVRMDVDDTITL